MQVKDLQLKRALRAALLVLLLNVVGMTNAYAVTIGDLTYSLNNSTLTATVTGHKDGTNATGSLTIPSSVTYTSNEYVNGEYVPVTRTYIVTEIGYMAFYHCSGLVGDLTIPNSVTTIKAHAFDCCTGFTGSLTIGNSVTTINDVAFNGCSGFTEVHYNAINCNDYTGFGGEEVMPFGNCGGTFFIGENVQRIPGAMFGYGNFTGNLSIPNSVTSIGDVAFRDCSSFTGSLNIGNSVTSIGYGAFANCSGFTGNLTIPNSVTTIGDYAFYDCSGFTGSLTIPNSVTTIGDYAFYGCSGFTGNLTIGDSVTMIGNEAFNSCSGFTGSLTIPNSVMTIGDHAFRGCSSFSGNLIMGNSVTNIGVNAFYLCSGFTGDLTIPNSVSRIRVGAFLNCSGFDGVLTIPNSVDTIDISAFKNCSSFTAVHYNATSCVVISSSYSSYERPPFLGCGGSLIIGDNVVRIPACMFKDGGFTGSLTIPNSVTTIGESAFYGCIGFSEVNYNVANHPDISDGYNHSPFRDCGGHLNIGNDVERIPNNMFYHSGFNSLTMGNAVTEIGKCAFAYSTGLAGSLILPDSMIEIDSAAFLNCTGFTGSLTIPNTVTSIGDYAFASCSGFDGTLTLSNSLTKIGHDTFSRCSGFTGNLIIPNSITKIEIGAFYYCSGFTGNLTIPDSVETIEHGAFDGCSGFTGSLIIGNSVTTIGYRAFAGCNGFMGNLTIGESVSKIDYNAFDQCSGFTGNLVVPNSMDTIGVGVFRDCSGFADTLFIGTGIRYIDESAFRRCSGIKEIQYNAINCEISGTAEYPVFNELPNLNKIVIGENVEFLPNNLFANCYSTQFIRSYAEVPPVVGGANAFFGIDKEILVGVPCGTLEDYDEAAYWSEFNNYTDAEYLLAVQTNPEYLGRAVIVQQPNCNSSRCVVRAIPERGCRFVNWTCNGEEVTQIISYAFDLDEDKVMVANFETMRHFSGAGGTFVWSDPANWEPEGVPTDTMAVDIQANVIIDTDVSVGSVFNYSDKVLTVMPDMVLTVNQKLCSPNASGIVVEDGGQIAHHNEGAMATVKKTVEAYDATNDNWNLISFPLADTSYVTLVTNMLSNDYDLYYYDEPTHYWINQEYAENGFDQLEAGKGCLYANSGCINYDFENGNLGGWTTIDADGDGHNWEFVSNEVFSHNGTGHIESASYINNVGPLTPDNYIVSPRVDFTPSSEISFWACAKDNGYAAEHFSVAISLAGNIIASDFTTIQEWTMSAKSSRTIGSWYQYTVNLGDFAGLTGYVAIRHFDCTDMFYLIVDEITLSNVHSYVPLSFTGELEKGNAVVNIPLSYTETAGNLKGFNLVGNPFVHNVTSYGSTNVAEGCFRLNDTKDNLIVSEVSETLPLKPAEGFFVKATAEGASITFNSGRSRGETERKGFVNLELRDNGKLIDRLIVKKDGDPLEKLTLKENGTRLYAMQNKQEIAIVSCEGDEQPVNFKAAKNGSYMITTSLDNMAVDYLHLIDNLTGADVDLLVEPSYSFDACTMDYASRFRLVFSVCGDADGDDAPFAFINNGNIIIIGAEAGAVLQIVDVLGHVLVSRKGDAINRISTNGMASGVYILRLIQGEDVKTQKIVIE